MWRPARGVAVNRPGKGPQLTPVSFLWDGEAFIFSTPKATAKHFNIKRDPNISLIVNDEAAHSFVAAHGSAEILEGEKMNPETLRATLQAILEKYLPAEQREQFAAALSAEQPVSTHRCQASSRKDCQFQRASTSRSLKKDTFELEEEGEEPMKVEIWSDIACPWCYISKRRFESALAQFEHRDQIEITWRSYQLDPNAPRTSEKTVTEILEEKYGVSQKQAAAMNDKVSGIAAQEGLEYHLEQARYGNTFDAHRLIHLAATHHLQDEMKERLFKAYFTEGAGLGETETLVKLAVEIGIDADEARSVLTSETYANEVRADTQRAKRLGIGGVPFFVIDEKYSISGAQPSEVIREALLEAWTESHPLIRITGTTQDVGYCEG